MDNKGVHDNAFIEDILIASVKFGEYCTYVGENAFKDCTLLEEINDDNVIESIGSNAFSRTKLTSATFNNLTDLYSGAFYECGELKSIYIPKCECIPSEAFKGCNTLESVDASSCTEIGTSAFENCKNLNNISLSNVKIIDAYAFKGCEALTSITIPDGATTIGKGAFQGCSSLKSIVIPDSVKEIEYGAFQDCKALISITIPDGVTTIKDYTFKGCEALTSIAIHDRVTSIGNVVFQGCSSLKSIVIPNSVTSIGINTFYDCKALTSINIPNGVTTIGTYTFKGCKALTSIDIPDSVTSIGESAFRDCSSLASIDIPDSITTIKNYTFYNCSSLKSIDIPDSVKEIEYGAFAGCSSLASITCNATTAPTIAIDTFQGVKAYGVLHYPTKSDYSTWLSRDLYYLGHYCWNSIVATYYISDADLSDYVNICSYVMPFSHIIIDGKPIKPSTTHKFSSEGIHEVVYMLNGNNNGFIGFNNCTSLTSIDIPNIITVIGAFSGCSSLKSINIPDSVTRISGYAFSDCSGLVSVTIPNSVNEIGDFAFSDCSSLTSITIPNSVKEIGNNVFDGCSSLESITCKSTTAPTITSDTFYGIKPYGTLKYPKESESDYISWFSTSEYYLGYYNWNVIVAKYYVSDTSSATKICNSNTFFSNIIVDGTLIDPTNTYTFTTLGEHEVVYMLVLENNTSIGNNVFENCNALTSITIPNGVKKIGNYVFKNCNSLTSITIPNSVTTIGAEAFYNCASLASITCNATTAPTINGDTFQGVKEYGVLHYPTGSDYSEWLSTNSGYLGYYNWNKMMVVAKYNVITTSSWTRICQWKGEEKFEKFIVDGTLIDPTSTYTFATLGEHEVIYILKDNYIESSSFTDCKQLTSITIPNGVTSIGDFAFYNIDGSSLTSVVIPNSVTSIGYNAFAGCKSLSSITCYATTAPTIDETTFDCDTWRGGKLYYPSGSNYSKWLSYLGKNWVGESI